MAVGEDVKGLQRELADAKEHVRRYDQLIEHHNRWRDEAGEAWSKCREAQAALAQAQERGVWLWEHMALWLRMQDIFGTLAPSPEVVAQVVKTGNALLDWIDTPPTKSFDGDPVVHSMALEEDFRAALAKLEMP